MNLLIQVCDVPYNPDGRWDSEDKHWQTMAKARNKTEALECIIKLFNDEAIDSNNQWLRIKDKASGRVYNY